MSEILTPCLKVFRGPAEYFTETDDGYFSPGCYDALSKCGGWIIAPLRFCPPLVILVILSMHLQETFRRARLIPKSEDTCCVQSHRYS